MATFTFGFAFVFTCFLPRSTVPTGQRLELNAEWFFFPPFGLEPVLVIQVVVLRLFSNLIVA